MDSLPDEMVLKIMELGIKSQVLSCRDLCCLAISSRRLCWLSNHDPLWKSLFSIDFPNDSQISSHTKIKSLYQIRFERVRSAKVAAHRRAVLRVQSQISCLRKECRDMEFEMLQEKAKLDSALNELKNIERARQCEVALKAWQPQVVQLGQQKVIQHAPVPTRSRIQSLQMEVAVCKERIVRFNKSINEKNKHLEKLQQQLTALTYKPLKGSSFESFCTGFEEVKNHRPSNAAKRKAKDCFTFSLADQSKHKRKLIIYFFRDRTCENLNLPRCHYV